MQLKTEWEKRKEDRIVVLFLLTSANAGTQATETTAESARMWARTGLFLVPVVGYGTTSIPDYRGNRVAGELSSVL